MLILSRRAGEAIHLDQHIKITVLKIGGNQVRIGIEAPENVTIHRDNIKNIIKEENNQAKEGYHEQ